MTEPNVTENHKNILEQYVEWFVTPPCDRLPDEKTQCMIADKLNITRKTLHLWERMPYFKERVAKVSILDRAGQIEKVKQVLYCKALEGDIQAVKVYKEWIAEINDKLDINTNGNVTIDLKAIIKAENDKE